ncbi:MAG: hypothetical protein V5A88_05610 [Candidatus Thermoplasmatota archaeon]
MSRNKKPCKCHLLMIEFLFTPVFFLLITDLMGDKFSFKINLIVLISLLFFFGITQILFLTTLKKSPVLPDNKMTKLTTYAGIVTSVIYPLLLILAFKIYFDSGAFTISFTRYYFLIGCLIWALSLVLIAYLVFRTSTKRANLFAIGGVVHALVILLPLVPFTNHVYLPGVVALFILPVSITSVVMAFVSGSWVDRNIERIT